MFRSKDFLLMDVIDIQGRRVGFINDILINFHKAEVLGFVLSSYRLFQKTLIVEKKDIVSFNKMMVIAGTSRENSLKFSEIKNMDILNKYGDVVGMTEDILFHEFSFNICGLVSSTGFLKNLVKGKSILLMNNLILGDESILLHDFQNKISFRSVPHKIFTEEECHEESI